MDSINSCQVVLGLSQVSGLGNVLIKRLLDHFLCAEKILEASRDELEEVKGIHPRVIANIACIAWEKVFQEYKKNQDNQIQMLHYRGKGYPSSLLSLYDPPALLYVKGSLEKQDEKAIAIVGTRHATSYGIREAFRFARDLAKKKITIVSGLARGIDVAAHQGALNAQGRTLAILGSGVHNIYPTEHTKIAHEIIKKGALISEYPINSAPLPHHFPQRNRLVSGFSSGVIVVEGAKDSGAMITVDCALEQGKEVFAIPGEIGKQQSEGPNWLIQQGAKLATCAKDVCEEFPDFVEENLDETSEKLSDSKEAAENSDIPTSANTASMSANTSTNENSLDFSLSKDQKKIWDALNSSPQNIEMIAMVTLLPPAILNNELLKMEIQGIVKSLPGQCYVKNEQSAYELI